MDWGLLGASILANNGRQPYQTTGGLLGASMGDYYTALAKQKEMDYLNQYRQLQMQQLQNQMARNQRKDNLEAQQQEYLNQAIAGLPANQQDLARAFPDKYAASLFGKRDNKVVGNALVSPSGDVIYRDNSVEWGKPFTGSVEGKPALLQADKYGNVRAVPGFGPKIEKGMKIVSDGQGGFTFEMGDTTGGELSKKTQGAVEEDQMTAMRLLDDLKQVGERYNKSYLTRQGQAYGWLGKELDKIGFSTDEQKQFIAGKRQFISKVEMMFNQYRKEITGAAASVQELERLKESFLNKDLAPSEFEALYSDFVNIAQNQLVLANRLRENGFTGKELIDRLDSSFYQLKGSAPSLNGGWKVEVM